MKPTIAVPTVQQLLCFDAVVTEGSFQAAAEKLNRTHPTVFTAVKNLETDLGLELLDRQGYRVTLSAAGRSFHEKTRTVLRELDELRNHAAQLAMGEESELHVVIGDLCPMPGVLGLLRRFFDGCPATRLHLYFEAISGPWERLFDDEADLIIHHVDKTDPRLEFVDLCTVELIPVVAPGFLGFAVSREITPAEMRNYVQCIIRDTARHSPTRDYYVIEGAHNWTVGDQLMKKEIILQGMGWGHMPTFLIERELREDRLIPITGKHFPGARGDLVAARRRNRPHGPVATRLWRYIEEQAPAFAKAVHEVSRGRGAKAKKPRRRRGSQSARRWSTHRTTSHKNRDES